MGAILVLKQARLVFEGLVAAIACEWLEIVVLQVVQNQAGAPGEALTAQWAGVLAILMQALEVGLPLVGHLIVDVKLFVRVVWQNLEPCVKSAARNGFIGRVCVHSSLCHAQS